MSQSVFNKASKQQGSYYLLPMMGLWVKAEAGGLWSGPYTTTDGSVFTIAGSASSAFVINTEDGATAIQTENGTTNIETEAA